MSTALPVRFRARNTACATAAPAAFVLLATRPMGADRCETLLRGDYLGSFPNAKRHAVHVLGGLVARHGHGIDVQVLDGAGIPVFIATDCGGAAGGGS